MTKWGAICPGVNDQMRAKTVHDMHFRAVMDVTAEAIFLLDHASRRFIDCSDAACRLSGYGREELRALGLAELEGDSNRRWQQQYDAIIQGKCPPTFETLLRCKDGAFLPVEVAHRVLASDRCEGALLLVRDITERKKTAASLEQFAYYDPLTGLPNRHKFYQSLRNALDQAAKQRLTISVLIINLDKFREINDSLGFALGDQLLQQVGSRLVNSLRIRDVVGRLGGDEFGLILFNSEGSQGAAIVACKVLQLFQQPFNLDRNAVLVTVSIGVTVFPSDATDADRLIKYADSAMDEAKSAGRNTFRYFTAEMNARILAKRHLHDALNQALANNEFVLHYQPKINIPTGQWDSVEALIRWNHPQDGLVSPALFVPALEETGLIVPVGAWVINTVCMQIRDWEKAGIGSIKVAINVSAKQFLQDDLAASFAAAIQQNGIASSLLEIEITESLLMVDAERAITVLHELKQLDIQVSIDDFGTGYSSLAYLKRFPVDKLKIDLAFIRDITTSPSDAAITMAIIHMAHSLNLTVIAEGVETQEQLDFLQAWQCDKYQGYYFSRPLPAAALEQLWRASPRRLH